jgi:hypothetical protein
VLLKPLKRLSQMPQNTCQFGRELNMYVFKNISTDSYRYPLNVTKNTRGCPFEAASLSITYYLPLPYQISALPASLINISSPSFTLNAS